MLFVGLTGSIAVGKSFVSGILRDLGCHVLDADAIARDVVGPGTEGLAAIINGFGKEVLNPDGTLDRLRLGALVFEDPEKLNFLNSLLHPIIIAAQDQLLLELESKYPQDIAIVDAALMIETGSFARFSKIIVVHCDPEVQLERLIDRTGLSRVEASKRIAAQMPQEEKKRFADYLIDTSNGFEETRLQTEAVFHHLKHLQSEIDLKRSSK
jgi:dephospho-CoA kinase